MKVSEVVSIADRLVFKSRKKHLNDLERSIIEGVCEGRKYKDIAIEHIPPCGEAHVSEVAANLWKSVSETLGEDVKKSNFRSEIERYRFSVDSSTGFVHQINPLNVCSDININNQSDRYSNQRHRIKKTDQYLKDIPDLVPFYGRTDELNVLKKWILEEKCRSIVISGTIGIGKTSLARQLLEQIKGEFDEIVWQSVGCERSLVEFIDRNLLPSLSISSLPESPLDLEARISLLIEYIRQHRCLIILDDLDRLFSSGELAGNYANEYREYQELFRRLRETNHQSCLLLLSREEPSKLSGINNSLQLAGLSEAGKEVFRDNGLTDEDKWDEAIEYMGGNPSYLTAVSFAVNQLFGGRISEFCKYPELFLTEEVRSSLTCQFDRLSEPEKEVMKAVANGLPSAIAIEPTPVNMCQLIELLKTSPLDISNPILSLRRRGLIYRLETDNSILFSIQPIVRQFIRLSR